MSRSTERDSKGRLWLPADEIERQIEAELRVAGLYPQADKPVVDLESFVEKHLHVRVDGYADLPADVLGLTEFYPQGKPRIFINRDLTEEAMDRADSPTWLKGRWRSTMAHEASHVLFHQVLFSRNPAQGQLPDFEVEAPPDRQRCLKRDVQFGGRNSDWREVQANKGMAALLMPRALFCAVCTAELGVQRAAEGLEKGNPEVAALVTALTERFQVSRQAVSIRLDTLGIVRPAGLGRLL